MLRRVLNIFAFIAGGLFNVAVVAGIAYVVYTAATRSFAYGKLVISDQDNTKRASKEIILTIPEDADAQAIGKILEEHDLTTNAFVFYLQARLNGTYKLFQPGEYLLNANMSINKIMDILQAGKVLVAEDDLQVRIVEGLTNKQIAEYLEAEGYFTAQEFLDECANGSYSYSFLRDVPEERGAKRLEGYLFPDTYNLPPNPTPRDVIVRMLKRFDEVMTSELRTKADQLGITIDEAVILASIIEKEIKVPEERALCSAVIYNRIASDMKLQMCSTILYALDKHKDRLFDSDLEVVSPYNTYNNVGLPVGPISNPGAAAIIAALNPADVNYLYFVVSDEEKGTHVFTDDFDVFTNAKIQYNQKY